MHLINFTLSIVASCCLAACVASPHLFQSPSTVFQFSKATPKAWVENLAQRRNGDLLMLRFDVPELWSLDPTGRDASLIYTFPKYNGSATGLSGIIEYAPDIFAIVILSYTLPDYKFVKGSNGIWSVDFRNTPPTTKLTPIPQATSLNKVEVAKDGRRTILLTSDSVAGGIYALDVATGEITFSALDESMKPAAGSPIGINGVKLLDDQIYYTSNGKLYRIRISRSKLFCNLTLTATGSAEGLATIPTATDFALSEDGVAYVTADERNEVYKVTADGEVSLLANGLNDTVLAGPTSCLLGRMPWDKDVLYVATDGGQLAPINGTFTQPGNVVAVPLIPAAKS